MKGLTTLYFDCAAGAAGDMILGALIDAGVRLEDVRSALGSLAVGPETVWTEPVNRAGIMATKFCVRGQDDLGGDHHAERRVLAHSHAGATAAHRHDHGEIHAASQDAGVQPDHRTLEQIDRLIEGSGLSARGKARAQRLFQRLAEAESEIHGVPIDRVHLHEVGALDSIIDVIGTVFAIETLGAERVMSSPLNVGSGTVRTAHGVYPVPAPATLRLLQGAPVYAGTQLAELVTPTGALLITEYAAEFGPLPAMRLRRVGYGAGSRDFADTPNVVRVVIGDGEADSATHAVVVIEAEIDDMNPQIFGVLMDRLLAAGALDVYYTPIQMKKNRPGTLLTIIAAPSLRAALTSIVFRESTTIGVRYRELQRECLDREALVVETPLGPVRVKVARRDGVIMNIAPEFDDCVRLAAEHARPVKDVQALAIQAFASR